ncbi:HD domain-containing protein [Streptomyces albidoflavus]|uniref:HD domain-containing protein n=1 Tax=Streptomyces albidoflavus TaxID=1886 RepID=UPI0033D11162
MNIEEVDRLAAEAHAGQHDKIGVPYIEHVRAVAAGLATFGADLQMAGLLHDIIEDTDWTAERLRNTGVPDHVVTTIQVVTNQPDLAYAEKIQRITSSRDATLVKIADNAHNSHPDRAAQLPDQKRAQLAAKYRAARDVLWTAADAADIQAIISVVNPSLIAELRERAAS